MANPFYVEPANPLKALQIGQQSYGDARDRRLQDELKALQAEAGQLAAGGNYQSALARLLGGGDVRSASALSGIMNTQQDNAFRREEAARAQRNTDRSFGLQERQANRPDISTYDQGEGLPKIPIAINRLGETPTATPIIPQGLPPTPPPQNPFATQAGGKAMTENEGKASLFADRLATAHKTVSKLEKINREPGGTVGATVEKTLPEGVSNILVSGQRGQLMNAKRAFINALLRRESGAAIAASEFTSYDKEYFPQLGDTDEQINDKRKHRAEVIRGLAREAGRNYSPQFEITEGGFVADRKQGKPTKPADRVPQEGDTATNPQTGEKVTLRGGQWVPVP